MTQQFYGFSDQMFAETKIDFHTFKNGEHRFRVLPPYAPDKLFHKLGIHWGYKDQSGGTKSLVCTLETHDTCPICDVVNAERDKHKQKKARVEELNAMLATADANQAAQINAEIGRVKQEQEDLYSWISDFKRKPTYLWNIMTEEGGQKVLKLSYNGHEPLFNKIKFYWKERKINVSDPANNYLIWVSRTGQKAQTRYTYEVLDGSVRPIEVPELTDLSKVYRVQSPEYLRQVVEQGFVATTGKDPDPTEQDYSAPMPGAVQQPSHAQASAPQPTAAPAPAPSVTPQPGVGQAPGVAQPGPTSSQGQPAPTPAMSLQPTPTETQPQVQQPGQVSQPVVQQNPGAQPMGNDQAAQAVVSNTQTAQSPVQSASPSNAPAQQAQTIQPTQQQDQDINDMMAALTGQQ